SYHNSNRKIKLELLKIIQYNSLLKHFSSHIQEHSHLSNCLSLIIPKKATSSLAIQDEFNERDYQEFLFMSKNIKESTRAGSESFPDAFLNLKKVNINFMEKVIILLAEYYHNVYDKDFVLLSEIHLSDTILILLKVHVYGQLQLDAEIFRSMYSKGHTKSVKILV
ncbi:3403_t:CDS:1, partial [Funneliformis mosseae]